MNYSIRTLDAGMAGEILRIENACFRSPWSIEIFEKDLTSNPCSRYLGLFDGETLIGYGCVWLMMEEAHVMSVCILEKYRGQGLGERLMKSLITLSAASGAMFMELEVRASNQAARSMYHKLGFIRVGFKKGYYEDTGEDAIVMALIAMPREDAENDPMLIRLESEELTKDDA